jgi:hypothetical protein
VGFGALPATAAKPEGMECAGGEGEVEVVKNRKQALSLSY